MIKDFNRYVSHIFFSNCKSVYFSENLLMGVFANLLFFPKASKWG